MKTFLILTSLVITFAILRESNTYSCSVPKAEREDYLKFQTAKRELLDSMAKAECTKFKNTVNGWECVK